MSNDSVLNEMSKKANEPFEYNKKQDELELADLKQEWGSDDGNGDEADHQAVYDHIMKNEL